MKKSLAILLCAIIAFASCDDTTNDIGSSLTDRSDLLSVVADTSFASTESVLASKVLSRSATGYLGKVKDPELTGKENTSSYITCNISTQLHTFADPFPDEDIIVSRDQDGKVSADSCVMIIAFNGCYGDKLAPMKYTIHEMGKPMEEGTKYYTDFSPIDNGLIRTDKGSVHMSKNYAYTDFNLSDSLRNVEGFLPHLNFCMPSPHNLRDKDGNINYDSVYVDKDNVVYSNYGSYLMNEYYKNPENFRNLFRFTHNVCPGFYLESTGGIGCMANVYVTQMNVYFRYEKDGKIEKGVANFAGTDEVLQKNHIIQDNEKMAQLIEDGSCTYMKTPAGVFTRIVLPVDNLMRYVPEEIDTITSDGKKKWLLKKNYFERSAYTLRIDSINTARMTIRRINNSTSSNDAFPVAKTLLAVPDMMLDKFFDNEEVADYRSSFLVSYNSTNNCYTFGNISSIINRMAHDKYNFITKPELREKEILKTTEKIEALKKEVPTPEILEQIEKLEEKIINIRLLGQCEDNKASDIYNEIFPTWNKMVLIPVNTGYSTINSVSVLTSVFHNIALTSTKLEGGKDNPNQIQLNVIYTKFNKD